MIDWASGCGTADGASASDIRDPRFESGNRQLAIFYYQLYQKCIEKIEIEKKRGR